LASRDGPTHDDPSPEERGLHPQGAIKGKTKMVGVTDQQSESLQSLKTKSNIVELEIGELQIGT